ncbi:GNAT family N-acetyltransferase [Nocardia nepalensis]|uniref:GNAT family N-acetyltransferase n=1 Tax=Nocardia nepalensis TaxID=3375448 RepID=UPI003B671F48
MSDEQDRRMIVRRVGVDEWRLARAVRLDALAETRSAVFGSAFAVASAWTEGQWRSWMETQALFIAESDDGGRLGSAGGVLDADETASVASVWVRPDARGTGLSDLLVGAVTDWARASGHRQLRLWFTEDNIFARALYDRLGFTDTGRRRPALDDTAVTEVEMSMALVSRSATASARGARSADIRLRQLGPADEHRFRDLRERLHAAGFEFAKNYRGPWPDYLDRLDTARHGIELDPGKAPETFLIAEDADGRFIGSSDIRHYLTDGLDRWGGHIGYVVAPEHRERGYGTAILRQTLPLAKELGIHRALLTCRCDNLASRRVITACGGDLDTITTDGICRYWVAA